MTTLLLVHAHPDDECIATGGVMLRAHHDGIRVVLITATRGEEGDIHNMDAEVVRPRLGEVRTEELMRSCAILGVDRQEFLGYRDSGMPEGATPRHTTLDSTALRHRFGIGHATVQIETDADAALCRLRPNDVV